MNEKISGFHHEMVKPFNPQSLFDLRKHCPLLGSHTFLRFHYSSNLNHYHHYHENSSKRIYPNLVDNVSRILCEPRWFENKELKHVSHKLKHVHVERIVSSHRDIDVVVRFFYWITKNYSYKHDLSCYKAMLNRLVREGRLADTDHVRVLMVKECKCEKEILGVVDYFNSLRSKGVGYSLYSCNTLLIQMAKFQMVDAARDVFTQVLSCGIRPNLLTYNTMINMLCKKGKVREAESYLDQMARVDEALDMLNEMMEKNIEPTVYTFTVPISSLCAGGLVKKALNLVVIMREKGCLPNVQTYAALISGLFRTKQAEVAMGFYHKMLRDGLIPNTANGCKPDEWTYAELISGFCEAGDLDGASILFHGMLEERLIPNKVHYTTLIDGPETETYNAIISCLSKMNRLLEAQKLFEKMVEKEVSPNVITYTTLVDGLCRNGSVRLAFEIFHEMEKKNCMPNLLTYSSLVYGLCLEGLADEAEILLDEMESKRITPDHVIYTSLINGYISLNRVDHGFLLLQRMVDRGCRPNYRTFQVLIKGLEKECRLHLEKAAAGQETYGCSADEKDVSFENLFVRMSEYGFQPTVETYSTIVSGLCKEGKTTEAVELFRNMEEKGVNPDRNIYASLVTAHCNNSKPEVALEFFDLMLVKRPRTSYPIYKSLISAFCKNGQVGKALVLFEDMLDRRWDADEIVWTILIDGLLKEAEVETCVHFIHIMQSKNKVPNFQTYVMLAKEISAADESCDIHENSMDEEHRIRNICVLERCESVIAGATDKTCSFQDSDSTTGLLVKGRENSGSIDIKSYIYQ
ncbi:hypothetical protein OSB04_015687 [Centaurea solstitialis]|uniref:Pentatricopeptide repeat-containing protein n=1 Tax=Centaurea solstitialis TaxID=347529 RepID=A0AA38W956_9ASTR|nr:hypothetical protein OSB04_015687 [Centaurea solstitialis]